jgi:DNA polymerase-3 subunit delta'
MTTTSPYPWHAAAWTRLQGVFASGRIPHAWLLTGRAGIGKRRFAEAFAQRLLCETPEPHGACGKCRSCHLLISGNHPDFQLVTPLEDASVIGIDQVRALGEYFALKSHYEKAKIALVTPADSMNRASANALLKLLEEPPAGGFLLLLAARLDLLPATIRSRCQRLALDKFDTAASRAWLVERLHESDSAADAERLFELATGAPLAALEAADRGSSASWDRVATEMLAVARGRVHAVQAAQVCGDYPVTALVDRMLRYSHQVTLVRTGCSVGHGAQDDGLNSLADQLHSSRLAGFVAEALQIKAQALAPANFREADLADLLWQAWMRATRGAPSALREPREA